MTTGLIRLVALVLLAPVSAAAQESAPRDVRPVFALISTGEELHGQLLQLGPDTLTMLVSGMRREVPFDAVLRIQSSGDSLKNGAMIGGTVGLVWCVLLCGLGIENAGQYVAAAGVNTAFFALIGAGIDASIPGRTTLYSKPPTSAARALAFRVRF